MTPRSNGLPLPSHAGARFPWIDSPAGEVACAATAHGRRGDGASVLGTVVGVVVPRILGHATDLLFNGVIGRRLPAGISKDQAVAAAARAHDDNAFADLLSGMHVVPGHGVDFGAVARTLALALGMYLVAAVMIYAQARLLNVTVRRSLQALRGQVEDKLHRLPLAYFDTRKTGRNTQPGHQRHR